MEKSFKLGDIVTIDPANLGLGRCGKIIGVVTWLDGSTEGYYVSVVDPSTGGASRHLVSPAELNHYGKARPTE